MKKHEVGDYLQKNGDIYKIEPFQVHNEELAELGLISTFLRAATKEMFCTPFLIDENDLSFTQATKQQKEDFERIAQLYK
ncbi:hypothetical protein [Enterococcus sp. BWR-S5]|uniref:hypothetical protein n=1 Tax=Enterococcus sp. BWR-S5 TaxID=2787714 RepID=UPI001921C780|nr:hypothetical protein [Enterococcus sp. BWR-S5]MBL1227122.1 hypothetical protein [Enterococcus sp. BWR-S5]